MFKKIFLPLSLMGLVLVSCEEAGTVENITIENSKYDVEKLYVSSGNYVYIVKPKVSNDVINIIENKSNGKTSYPQTTALVTPKTVEVNTNTNINYMIVENTDSTITLKRVN